MHTPSRRAPGAPWPLADARLTAKACLLVCLSQASPSPRAVQDRRASAPGSRPHSPTRSGPLTVSRGQPRKTSPQTRRGRRRRCGRRWTSSFPSCHHRRWWPCWEVSAARARFPALHASPHSVLPIAAKCHLECLASGSYEWDPSLAPGARAVVLMYAQSFLAAGIDRSVRVAEGTRVNLWPDESDSSGVMRGHAYMGKDGSPIDINAPAEGFLGPY